MRGLHLKLLLLKAELYLESIRTFDDNLNITIIFKKRTMGTKINENISRVTWRVAVITTLVAIVIMFDFYDFNVLGFIITLISKPWHLTVGEATWLVGTSGLGIIIGGFVWGYISDRFGRKRSFIASTLIFSLGSAAMALAWTGAWVYLAVLRVFVGFGVAGAFTIAFPLVSELVPRSKRGIIVGLTSSSVPIGTLVASSFSAFLAKTIGWKGLALIAGVPAILVLALYAFIPESPRWLVIQGRTEEARRVVAKVGGLRPEDVDLSEYSVPTKKFKFKDVFKYKRSLVSSWLINLGTQSTSYTITLFGPTLLIAVMGISAEYAAFLFIFVSIAGLFGRIVGSFLNDIMGRRPAGYFVSITLIVSLVAQALTVNVSAGGISMFYLFTIITYFFVNGAWPIITALGSEEWPQEVRSSGWGSSYGFGGIGKIVGPAGLGLLLGKGLTLETPKVIVPNIPIAVIFLSIITVLKLVGFIIGLETKGKSLETIHSEITKAIMKENKR